MKCVCVCVLLGMFPYSLKEAQEKDVLPRPLDTVV